MKKPDILNLSIEEAIELSKNQVTYYTEDYMYFKYGEGRVRIPIRKQEREPEEESITETLISEGRLRLREALKERRYVSTFDKNLSSITIIKSGQLDLTDYKRDYPEFDSFVPKYHPQKGSYIPKNRRILKSIYNEIIQLDMNEKYEVDLNEIKTEKEYISFYNLIYRFVRKNLYSTHKVSRNIGRSSPYLPKPNNSKNKVASEILEVLESK